jgi:hypothetical protein
MRFIFFFILTLVSGCAYFEHRGNAIIEMVKRGDCRGAEAYARQMPASEDERMFALGVVSIECYRQRTTAIEYFKLAAQRGNSDAAQALIELGEKPPAISRERAGNSLSSDDIIKMQQIVNNAFGNRQRSTSPSASAQQLSCTQNGWLLQCNRGREQVSCTRNGWLIQCNDGTSCNINGNAVTCNK